jgi:hypothetical protein
MVDEVKIPTQEELLGEQTQEEVVVAPPELNPEEERASESGWVPKDQWKGDPDAWRPAKEFNERGELFNRIKQQSKDIGELRQAMTFLTNQQRKQYFQGFNDAIVQLKARRDAALEEGDLVAAQRFNDKIDEHKEVLRDQKQAAVAAPPVQAQPTQTFFSWADRNNWYTKDRKMTHFADAVGLAFKEENPEATESDMLRHVTQEVKERFPEKFQQVRSAPSPDGEGRGQARGSKSNYSSVEASMPEEHRQIMKTVLKTTGMSKEEYLKSYGS